MHEIDWYQASIPRPLEDVVESLLALRPGLVIGHARGHHGYASTVVLGSPSLGDVARVWHGGSHSQPHVVLSGHHAHPGAELIRASFPEHTVSRIDVKSDFTEEDAYDRLQAQLVDVAKSRRVKVDLRGDHLVTLKGRSCYLGSAKSGARMRLYDKAAEMRSKLAPPTAGVDLDRWYSIHGVPPHLTRLEAEIRPHTREAKAEFARLQPEQVLGAAAWMREVAAQVAGLELEPVRVSKGWRASDFERSKGWMLRAYRPVLLRMFEEHGSWECVGLQLGLEINDIERLRTGGR